MPFELFLALRYLRPKRTFVSVITLISVIGVMLGVAVLIIVISVMTGFDKQLREKILGFSADVKITKFDEALADYEAVAAIVRSNVHVKAVAPVILGPVMIRTQPAVGKPATAAPFVRGIDPEQEKRVSSLTTNLIAGSLDLDDQTLLIGSELADNLRLNVGDRVAIYSPRNVDEMERVLQEVKEGKRKDLDEYTLPEDYRIAGIFDVGYYEYNANVVVTSLLNAQDLYLLRGKVHGLLVKLHDPYLASRVRAELYDVLEGDYRISIWTEENQVILTALAVEKKVMFYLLFFIVIVAAFGITNSQITFVVQKTRDIGMLKALGATRGQIVWLFLGQSLIVGVIGVTFGLALGMLALEFRNEFLHFMNRMTGLELFPAQIYAFTELPAVVDAGDVAIICSTALVICGLGGLAPAWNAGRLKPVEALRHE
jgi:lipoprotein-releasing system permease protein